MIAIILPSRGFIFARVEDAISRNLRGYDYRVYRSFTLPIPDCQNQLVEQALRDDPDYLLFMEEDVVMPDNAISDMMKMRSDIACIDYGVGGVSCTMYDKKTNELLWCGLGCTLVKREVFRYLEKPYFRSDKKLLLNDWPKTKWVDVPFHRREQEYGGQDIWFCMQVRAQGYKIKQAKGECVHLKLEALGKPGRNHGLHETVEKPRIHTQQYL